jgi:hypothetical protein
MKSFIQVGLIISTAFFLSACPPDNQTFRVKIVNGKVALFVPTLDPRYKYEILDIGLNTHAPEDCQSRDECMYWEKVFDRGSWLRGDESIIVSQPTKGGKIKVQKELKAGKFYGASAALRIYDGDEFVSSILVVGNFFLYRNENGELEVKELMGYTEWQKKKQQLLKLHHEK